MLYCEFVMQKIMFDLFYSRHFQVQLLIIIVIVIGKPDGGQEDYQERAKSEFEDSVFNCNIES